MRAELFAELLESVREGGAILRGQLKPSREFGFDEPDVKALREGYGLSQTKFAALLGISPGTLRNWEQGRRKPEGSARVLLQAVCMNALRVCCPPTLFGSPVPPARRAPAAGSGWPVRPRRSPRQLCETPAVEYAAATE